MALFKPLRHCFDYLMPAGEDGAVSMLQPGMRLLVPFGRTQAVAVLLAINQVACVPVNKLRPITAVLDANPLITPSVFALYQWASRYYQHPIGEVILGTFPTLLRCIPQPNLKLITYALSAAGRAVDLHSLKRSPRQMALLSLFRAQLGDLSIDAIKQAGFSSELLRTLVQKDWVAPTKPPLSPSPLFTKPLPNMPRVSQAALSLNEHQRLAVTQVTFATGFQAFLLEGVTGSGKTEVYLHIIDHYLKQGKQALVLVPEIGLTPQTIARFEQRFSVPIVALHSGLSNKQRLNAWIYAKKGEARIVIGTRSAIFTPFACLGVIILDEEHDPSFKQPSGFRYSARDLAVVRGRLEDIPIVLGTATPSLETLSNANTQRFTRLVLPMRAGNAKPPSFQLIDLRNKPLKHGVAPELLTKMQEHLGQGNQVLLFLNRRGYAPLWLCHGCGWAAPCLRCDAKLTVHREPLRLVCHHCSKEYPLIKHCGVCQGTELFFLGLGTERLEHGLQEYFPGVEIIRLDRDSVVHKQAMEKALAKVQNGHRQILCGTQMLAKGHHFPNVTLVGIIDTDSGLCSTDFRATERMGQLILQVAGRAGRAEKPGQVLLQTHQPNHPLLQLLIRQDYPAFAQALLQERRSCHWPPFSYLALLRAEARNDQSALDFLMRAKSVVDDSLSTEEIQVLGPIPAAMERKGGYFRALLLFQAKKRHILQRWLNEFVPKLEAVAYKGKVRWSLDVDPLEMN